MSQPSMEQVWEELNRVMDPEIPVVSLVELGIVREVGYEGEQLVVTLTPTFAGCPALEVMKTAVLERMRELGLGSVLLRTVLSPPWTTDWIVPEARRKLKAFRLAPRAPPNHSRGHPPPPRQTGRGIAPATPSRLTIIPNPPGELNRPEVRDQASLIAA